MNTPFDYGYAIYGAVIAVMIFALLLVCVALPALFWYRRRKDWQRQHEQQKRDYEAYLKALRGEDL